MSLRALAKIRTFWDFVVYANFFYALGFVERLLRDCSSAVDIGFGKATWLHLVPFDGVRIQNDVWEATQRQTDYKMRAAYALDEIVNRALPPGCVDAVLCLDVIEHFPKMESQALLTYVASLARRVVVISVPNGFQEQLSEDGDPYHLCGWEAAEFRAQGFEVHGIMGPRALRGTFGRIARKPPLFWWLVSKLAESKVWNHPERAFMLLAVKKKI